MSLTNKPFNFFDTNPTDYLEYGFAFRAGSLSWGRARRQTGASIQAEESEIRQAAEDQLSLCEKLRKCAAALIVFGILMSFRLLAAVLKADRLPFLPLVYLPVVIGALMFPVTRWYEKHYNRQWKQKMTRLYYGAMHQSYRNFSKQRQEAGVPEQCPWIDVLHHETTDSYDGETWFTNTSLLIWRQEEQLCLMDDERELIWKIPIRAIHEADRIERRVGLARWNKGDGPLRGWVTKDRDAEIITEDTPYEIYGLTYNASGTRVTIPAYYPIEIGGAAVPLMLLVPEYDIDVLRRTL